MNDELYRVWIRTLRKMEMQDGFCLGVDCSECPFSSDYDLETKSCGNNAFYQGEIGEARLPTVKWFLELLEEEYGDILLEEHRRIVKQYRWFLDSIKVRAYELGQMELHNMALKALKEVIE